jgi:PEP-CTERM motif
LRKLAVACVVLLSLCIVTPCSAALIVASGAGSAPATAQDLTGLFPTEIVGTLSGTDQNDVNVFKIYNRQPLNFSSITVLPGAFGIPDTVLTLFDTNGVGVFLNDDISGSNTLSCLPSAGGGNLCPTTGTMLAAGFYYLAISRSRNYPLDGSSVEIFDPVLSTDVAGPFSTSPFGSWDGYAFTSPDFDLVNYDIMLNGTVPEPATWLLTAGAGLIFGLLRRRRR